MVFVQLKLTSRKISCFNSQLTIIAFFISQQSIRQVLLTLETVTRER